MQCSHVFAPKCSIGIFALKWTPSYLLAAADGRVPGWRQIFVGERKLVVRCGHWKLPLLVPDAAGHLQGPIRAEAKTLQALLPNIFSTTTHRSILGVPGQQVTSLVSRYLPPSMNETNKVTATKIWNSKKVWQPPTNNESTNKKIMSDSDKCYKVFLVDNMT